MIVIDMWSLAVKLNEGARARLSRYEDIPTKASQSNVTGGSKQEVSINIRA